MKVRSSSYLYSAYANSSGYIYPDGHGHYCNSNNLTGRKMSFETYYVCVRRPLSTSSSSLNYRLRPKNVKPKETSMNTRRIMTKRVGFTLQSLAIGTCCASLWLRAMLHCSTYLEALHETVLFEDVAKRATGIKWTVWTHIN
jgi:hypothetical protein